MGLGNIGDSLGDLSNLNLDQLQQYLPGLDFPAGKDEVVNQVQSNGAPQEVTDAVKNSSTQTFNSADEVLQAVRGNQSGSTSAEAPQHFVLAEGRKRDGQRVNPSAHRFGSGHSERSYRVLPTRHSQSGKSLAAKQRYSSLPYSPTRRRSTPSAGFYISPGLCSG